MKKNLLKVFIALALLTPFLFSGCDETTGPEENPIITQILPIIANIGDEITITGSNFGGDYDQGSVEINGAEAKDYTSWKDTEIKVKIPSGAALGKGTVVVINNGKRSSPKEFFVGPENPASPTKLRATSINNTTVRIAWDAAPNEDWSIFKDYVLEISPGAFAPISIPKNQKQYDVDNLTDGIEYTFTLYSRYSNDKESLTPIMVKWSPAHRYTEVNQQEIKVYVTESVNFGSGLDLYDETNDGPQVLKIASSDLWDLGLYTTGGVLKFGPARGLPYNYSKLPTKTEISDIFIPANSLDSFLDSLSMDKKLDYSETPYDLENEVDVQGFTGVIFLVRVQNQSGKWNYAKVFVKKVGGSWLQGTAPDRYIEVVVSYQKTADVPYAKKPGI